MKKKLIKKLDSVFASSYFLPITVPERMTQIMTKPKKKKSFSTNTCQIWYFLLNFYKNKLFSPSKKKKRRSDKHTNTQKNLIVLWFFLRLPRQILFSFKNFTKKKTAAKSKRKKNQSKKKKNSNENRDGENSYFYLFILLRLLKKKNYHICSCRLIGSWYSVIERIKRKRMN